MVRMRRKRTLMTRRSGKDGRLIGDVYRLTLSPNRDAEATVHRRGGEDRGDLRFVARIRKGTRQKIFQLNRQLVTGNPWLAQTAAAEQAGQLRQAQCPGMRRIAELLDSVVLVRLLRVFRRIGIDNEDATARRANPGHLPQ